MDNDKIKLCYAYLDVADLHPPISPTSLRGFLGYLFVEDTEFHHHSDNPYHYPLVQYKKVNGRLMVLGLNDYAKMVYDKVSSLDCILTPRGKVPISSIDIVTKIVEIQETIEKYRFLSPWIALSEENFPKFMDSSFEKRKDLLTRILIGNILSALKGLGIFIKFRVTVDIGKYKLLTSIVHDNKFLTLKTSFTANITIPEYIGLGKSVSKGFGMVGKVK